MSGFLNQKPLIGPPGGKTSIEQISISRDLSGGVRFSFGDKASFVLSPQNAVEMATAILKQAGLNVEFVGTKQ